jgi:C4-dicarboxylate-specific signal transduction histidine kinase
MNVLIVEDSLSARTMLRITFRKHGCDVIEAKDGQEGLELAARHIPDIIISDALMPRMDGFQLLRALKADPALKSIPFIFHSSTYTGRKEAELAISLGAEAFIPKPVDPDHLWEKTCAILKDWEERYRRPAHPDIEENDERYLREYSGIVATKLEEKVQELEEALALRKQAEENLLVINAELEERVATEVEKNREKDRVMAYQGRLAAMGEMLSNISHQWRQPLNNVALLVQNLQVEFEYGQLTPKVCSNTVDQCMKELTYLSRTIDTFRAFYQPDLVSERFALYPAVTEAVALVREDLGSHGILVETTSDSDSSVTGYKHEFSQVILSIIGNAKEAIMLRKPAEPFIRITCTQEKEMAVVTLRDNGGGVPADVLDKIFDPYFTTKFMSQGRGLGLYMSRMIIEKYMGGRISVNNSDTGVDVIIQTPLSPSQEISPR